MLVTVDLFLVALYVCAEPSLGVRIGLKSYKMYKSRK